MSDNRVIGRLISSNSRGYQFGCHRETRLIPQIGAMVAAEILPDMRAYGVISNFNWYSDEMVVQMARAEAISVGVLADNQIQRSGGPIVDVCLIGYHAGGLVHTLPPQPPVSLEQIWLCSPDEILRFSSHSFSYLRLILEAQADIPVADVIAAHLQQAHSAHRAAGDDAWIRNVMGYLTGLLLADYEVLAAIAESVAQKIPAAHFKED